MAGITASELNVILTARDREFSRSMDRAIRKVSRFEKTTNRSLSKTSRGFSNLGRSARSVGPALSAAIPAAAPIAAAAGATALLATAFSSAVQNGDKLRLLSGRIEAITGSAAQAATGVAGLTQIMFETGSSLDGAASAFTRFTQAGKAIGATQKETLQLTDTLLKLGRIGGGTEQELTSGAVQLSQALASGQLRGDELRSVMENLPSVTEALASSLGVGIGQLREMAEAGELTSRKVFDALLSKSEETNRRFEQMPLTVEVASGRMAAAWTRFTAGIDESLGLSQKLASVLDGIANDLDRRGATGLRAINFQLEEAEQRLSELQNPTGLSSRENAGFSINGVRAQIEALRERRSEILKFAADKENAEARGAGAAVLAASQTGAAIFAANQERERELALMDRKAKAILDAQNTAEANLREASPLATPEQIAEARDFAAETVRLQQARIEQGKTVVDQEAALYEAMSDQLDALRIRQALVGQTEAKQSEILTRERLIAEARRRNIEITEEIVFQIEDQARAVGELTDLVVKSEEAERSRANAVKETKQEQERLKSESLRANEAMAVGLTNAALQADSLEDALKRVAIQLVEIAASGFITGALNGKSGGGSILGDLFSGFGASIFGGSGAVPGSAGASGSIRAVPGATGFANGGAFTNGIVTEPTPFSFGGGKPGVMGEAGPEAVMPLMRGPGGKLGVRSSGGSSQQAVHVTVTAGPEFDVRVQQAAGPQTEGMIGQNNAMRDRTFRPRMMAAQDEVNKDYR